MKILPINNQNQISHKVVGRVEQLTFNPSN